MSEIIVEFHWNFN